MFADHLRPVLAAIRLAPFLLRLDTNGLGPSASLLRGVWGAALHHLDRPAYDAVFAPPGQAAPGYLLAQDPEDADTFHWRLFGAGLDLVVPLRRAWDVASGMGLGPNRQPFFVRQCLPLGPDGQAVDPPESWALDRAGWPLAGDPPTTPCRLAFPNGVRLLRDGRLIASPTLPDLVVATLRRLRPLLPDGPRAELDQLHGAILDAARLQPARPWQGVQHRLQRWSARQKEEVELRGVRGELELPAGPGPLWPLLAVAAWLHLGKGTTNGLGLVWPVGCP